MELAGLLPFVLIFVLFWFLLVRPARQQQRRMAEVQAQLTPGTSVRTGSGLYGTVTVVHDDTVELEVAQGVVVTFARAAVTQVVTPAATAAPEPPAANADEAPSGGAADEAKDRPQT
jgi:preprotein translocase subunit YajC